ncbi:D-alanyl-D-alanine-carboxypeptidase / D-alanyl-D-alanine-endopeptidase [Streptomyces sp. yr375]|uniref:serine hydrolase domain-containing protein n=1 Tax=Streptomyces sp. yr375 TaxID=1761906 RepID=UPI0008D4B2A5|nr:serine hydrolase domain-containing protein [Streptomyces sp. yr375]SER89935.1 D-alanyl-D-alanine-carboxypeptidase / D-alanyl-D-alanine-endopeptidase [Streptomyces sp. yr375]
MPPRPLVRRRVPTCVLSHAAPPALSDGHAVDRYVPIGSLTKVVTGTALTRMAAAGVLSLDDPVERWLPDAPATGITLLHLARHTSGLPRLPPGRLAPRDPYAAFDRAALHALLPRLGSLAERPPGQEEEYSNLGYALLGEALTAACGTTYEEVGAEYVLRPLDITEMTARPDPDRCLQAPGLFGRPRRPWTMDGAILPAGGLWATPRAVADLVVRLLVERRLGDPAPTWVTSGPLRWHNGATLLASLFAGALPDGAWVVVHRLNGDPDDTDQLGITVLEESRQSRQN